MLNEATLFYALLSFLGFVAHVLKKAGTEKVNPVEYLAIHKGRTYTALSGAIASFVSLLVFHPEAGPIEFFALGYMADSIANRTPTESEIASFRAERKKIK